MLTTWQHGVAPNLHLWKIHLWSTVKWGTIKQGLPVHTLTCTLVYLLFFFCLFRAVPTAYGGSQGRDQIGAAATDLCHSHSNMGSELHLQPTRSSQQRRILNPLSKARDRTCVLMNASQIGFHWTTTGTPTLFWDKGLGRAVVPSCFSQNSEGLGSEEYL